MLQLSLSTTCRRASCHSLSRAALCSSSARGTLHDRLASLLPPASANRGRASLWTTQSRTLRNRAPAFFHTSRPDFLPSSGSSASPASAVSHVNHASYAAPPHQGRAPYTPHEGTQPALPPIEALPTSLHPLHYALGQPRLAADLTWQVYLTLDEASRASFTSDAADVVALWRCLWWSIASFEPSVPIELPHLRSTDTRAEIQAVLRASAAAVRSFRELRHRLDALAKHAPEGGMREMERARFLYVHTAPSHLLRQMRTHMPHAADRQLDVASAAVLAQVRALGPAIPALLAKRAAVALAASGRGKQAVELLSRLPSAQQDSRTFSAILCAFNTPQQGLTDKLLHLAAQSGSHALPERDAVVGQMRLWPAAQLARLVEAVCPVPLNAVQAHEKESRRAPSVFVDKILALDWCAPHAALALLTSGALVGDRERAVRFVEARRRGEIEMPQMPEVQGTEGELQESLPEEVELQDEEQTLLLQPEEVRQRWDAWSALYLVTSQWVMDVELTPSVRDLLDPAIPLTQVQPSKAKEREQARRGNFLVSTAQLHVLLAATRLRMAASASEEQRFAAEHSRDKQLLERWHEHVLRSKRLAPTSVVRVLDHVAFNTLTAYLEQLRRERDTFASLDVAAHLTVLELLIRLRRAKAALSTWRTLHERPRTADGKAPMSLLSDELFEYLLLLACGKEPSHGASRYPKPTLAFTLYLARIAELPRWRLGATSAIRFIETLLGSGKHGLEAFKIMQHLAESGTPVTARHSVALVGTFAKAGEVWADHTLGIAENLTMAWAARNAAASARAEDDADVALPPLEMYAYALDASSRAFIGWTPKRRERIFALFASFRAVLRAYLTRSAAAFARAKLYPPSPLYPPAHAPPEDLERSYEAWYADSLGVRAARKAERGEVQRQTLLMAYNSAMRAYLAEPALEQGLSAAQLKDVPEFEPLLKGTGLAPASWKELDKLAEEDVFEVLLHELESQLGVMGNAQTWGLRIVRPLLPFQVREQHSAAALEAPAAEASAKIEQAALSSAPNADDASELPAPPHAVAAFESTLSWKALGFTREEIFSAPPRASALDTSAQLFAHASQASYLRGGDLTLPLSGSATRQSVLLQPVRLKSADVGKFVVALARGGRFEQALEVLGKWETRHMPSSGPAHGARAREAGVEGRVMPGGWDHAVVGSRLAILALLGDRPALEAEMQRLDAHARMQDTNKILGRKHTQPYRINHFWRSKLLGWTEQAEQALRVQEGKAKEDGEEGQSLEELRRRLAWKALAAGQRPIDADEEAVEEAEATEEEGKEEKN